MRVRSAPVLPVLATLILTTALAGCEKSPREKLQGTWVGETVANVHPTQQARAEGWARATRLEFAGNKATVALPAESPRSGTFKVAQGDAGDLEVLFRRPEGGDDRSRFAFTPEGKLIWTLGGGAQVTMKRME